MNNIRRFNTEADYSAATLNYPAVSWVMSGDTVHYDKEAPLVNDKLMLVTNGDGLGEDQMILYNCGAYGAVTGLTINDVAVTPVTCITNYHYSAEQVYVVKYEFDGTEIGEWLTGNLGMAHASEPDTVDVFIPSHITSIGGNFPNNVKNLVVAATTPPYVEALGSTLGYDADIYVPDNVVDTYKADGGWGDNSDKIHPISEYSGNLPL